MPTGQLRIDRKLRSGGAIDQQRARNVQILTGERYRPRHTEVDRVETDPAKVRGVRNRFTQTTVIESAVQVVRDRVVTELHGANIHGGVGVTAKPALVGS